MKIGLFFGSFNPVHVGHMVLANYMLEFTDLEKIWFVVSPHNPLKKKSTLLADHHRIALVRHAIGDNNKLKASNIEFGLPQPSYTVNTLAHLAEKHPKDQFALIMGSDNLESLHKWKNFEVILEHYQVYVYPRPGYKGGDFTLHKSVVMTEAPLMSISSTMIREAIKAKKNMQFFMPEAAWKYCEEMNFYTK
ncbi:MAG TPA: nicotinate (nicotinamide) nucleotide adenylyltransferase [Bacteroidia bacterium]|nr:nicotinate (nicotinamide) nucleotide adenylyltransferase [Bacteroidia bacterium]